MLFGVPGKAGWSVDELAGLDALRLLEDAVRTCAPDRPDVENATICLWAGLHGLVTLRRDRPSFPWPPMEGLLDTLLGGVSQTTG